MFNKLINFYKRIGLKINNYDKEKIIFIHLSYVSFVTQINLFYILIIFYLK